MSGTFISGISPIGQGTGEKRAGNLNFGHSDSKQAAFLASFMASYGSQGVPRAIWWCQVGIRWSGWSPGAARGLPDGFRAQKGVFWTPGIKRDGFE